MAKRLAKAKVLVVEKPLIDDVLAATVSRIKKLPPAVDLQSRIGELEKELAAIKANPHGKRIDELKAKGYTVLPHHIDCETGVNQDWIKGRLPEGDRRRLFINHPEIGFKVLVFDVIFLQESAFQCETKAGCWLIERSARMKTTAGGYVAFIK